MINRYPFPRNRSMKALFILILAAVLYLTRDSMLSMSILGFYKAQAINLALLAMVGIVFLVYNRRSIRQILTDRRIVLAFCMTVVILGPMVLKKDWQLMYFSILVAVYFGIMLSYFATVEQTARGYVLILSVLGAFSVIATYLLRIPADRGILVPPMFDNAFDCQFYFYGLSNVSVTFVRFRNFGIFREPGVYQYFLMLGLYLNNYIVQWGEKRLWAVNAVLIITMLTTFATGGVMEMAVLLAVMFVDKKWYKEKWICLTAVAAAAVIAVGVVYSIIARNVLYVALTDMFGKLFSEGDSISDRVGSLAVNLQLFLKNPMTGASIRETLYAIENNTSSSSILFAILGVLGGVIHVLSWFALTWKRENRLWVNLLLPLLLAMSFNTQNLITNPYLWLFPMMAVVENWLPVSVRFRKGETG